MIFSYYSISSSSFSVLSQSNYCKCNIQLRWIFLNSFLLCVNFIQTRFALPTHHWVCRYPSPFVWTVSFSLSLFEWNNNEFGFCIYSIRFTETCTTHGIYISFCVLCARVHRQIYVEITCEFSNTFLFYYATFRFFSRRCCVYFILPRCYWCWVICFYAFRFSQHLHTHPLHYHMPAATRYCDDSKNIHLPRILFSNAIYLTNFTFNFFYYLCFDFFVIIPNFFVVFFSFCSVVLFLCFSLMNGGFSFIFRQLLKF